jgi:hypothetical protein
MLLAWHGCVPAARAQNSDAFARTKQSLDRDRTILERNQLSLRLGGDALERQKEALTARASRINAMPSGIARDAAVTGYKRDRADWERRRNQLNIERQQHRDNVRDFNQRLEKHNRRVWAANQANTYRAGEYVWAEWRGRWWYAQILRAERGRYYIDWPGYGDEWNEWVGPNRLRR